MRISAFIWCGLCIFLASCAREKVSETTPKFHFSVDTVFTAYKDTLFLKRDAAKAYYLDSLTAGDTARLHLDVDGVFHNLLALNVSLSADTAAKLIFPDKAHLDSTFLASSDYDKGEFLLDGRTSRIPFSFQYYAGRASKNSKIVLKAVSDAGKENNTAYFSINAPVKRPKPARFYFSPDSIFTEGGDTLLFYSSTNSIDSMTAGDAAAMELRIDAGKFNLKEFYIDISDTDTADIILPAQSVLDSLFLSSSDFNGRKFMMDGKSKKLDFPFKLQAKKADRNFYIEFRVVSDAVEEYNESIFRLGTPIIPVKAVEEEKEEPESGGEGAVE